MRPRWRAAVAALENALYALCRANPNDRFLQTELDALRAGSMLALQIFRLAGAFLKSRRMYEYLLHKTQLKAVDIVVSALDELNKINEARVLLYALRNADEAGDIYTYVYTETISRLKNRKYQFQNMSYSYDDHAMRLKNALLAFKDQLLKVTAIDRKNADSIRDWHQNTIYALKRVTDFQVIGPFALFVFHPYNKHIHV
jgi:hypothetical protein